MSVAQATRLRAFQQIYLAGRESVLKSLEKFSTNHLKLNHF
jgi:hypothetical protein